MKKIIKITMLIISLTLIAGIAQFDLSQAANKGVKISKKHFPDPYFRKAVKKYYDYNKDGYLSKSETAFVFKMNHEPGHYLFGKSKKIWKKKHSLKGIEYFPELKELQIKDVNIGNPNIKENLQLECVYLYGTNTTYLNTKDNIYLRRLHIIPKNDVKWQKAHPLKNMDFSQNKKLEQLLVPNGLSKIDVSMLTKLQHLNVAGGKLTKLDISNNAELATLDCSGNALTELNLSHNPELTVLLCQNNKLRKLTFFEEPWLAWLDCSGNSLAEVDMKNGCVTDTWKRDPGTVFQNILAD